MPDYLLGIDNGGTISKVVLFDTHGREVAAASRKVNAVYPRPGWVERSMQDVWQSTAEAIRVVIVESGIAAGDIRGIGNTGHGNGVYLLDKQRRPLRNAILSVDSRSAGIVAEWQQNGVVDTAWHSVYQQSWTGQVAALLTWLKRYEPDTYSKIGHVLLCKDYIKFCLTGTLSTDFMDMSGTGLFDVQAKTYGDDLFTLYGIEEMRTTLPPAAESIEIIGQVSEEAAKMTGLRAGTPVSAGIFDVSACALSAGVLHPGQACVVAGTWSINEVVTADVIDNHDLFMNSVYLGDSYLMLEASPTSASNLEWFVTEFCAAEQAEAKQRGISVYEVCNEVIERTPGTTVLFHPFLYGSNVGATARAGFYGAGGWHTHDHLLRAVYEGIVYTHLSHIDRLRRAGVQVDSARLTGGGARSKVWSQMFADALAIPMEVVTGDEMGARGAAICAGIGAGIYKNYADAAAQVVQVEHRYQPNPERFSYYQARYQQHQRLAEVLRGVWDAMAGLE